MKQILINIVYKTSKYNTLEYKRLINIIDSYKDKLQELQDIKSEIKNVKDKITNNKERLNKKEIILKEKQKEYELSASESNIELYNSIRNNENFDSKNIKSILT